MKTGDVFFQVEVNLLLQLNVSGLNTVLQAQLPSNSVAALQGDVQVSRIDGERLNSLSSASLSSPPLVMRGLSVRYFGHSPASFTARGHFSSLPLSLSNPTPEVSSFVCQTQGILSALATDLGISFS